MTTSDYKTCLEQAAASLRNAPKTLCFEMQDGRPVATLAVRGSRSAFPLGFSDKEDRRTTPRHNERTGRIDPLFARTQRHDNSCLLRGVRLWRSLPDAITSLPITDRDEVTQLCKADAKHL
ncbi:hypothetical protein HPB47_012394 [Ixodes persulcatus]|uniref:Uncharacterized protein n=1 Tax=Ixodes persulcatus TaxID=34615 RepID=A0AC60NTL3_IXOPE|nr:hypothetical protein HPB47_012394 [Ixodes persulcatus]